MRIVGGLLLVAYLFGSNDWRLSLPWALAFPVIALLVSWLVVSLNLPKHLPRLDGYLLFAQSERSLARTDDEWALAQAKYLEGGLRSLSILATPLEDSLFCVPLLWVGVTPLSVVLVGAVFGACHLGRFSFIECIGKALYYAAICYVVLPHGLLTVAAGHLITDALGLLTVKVVKFQLSRQSRANPAVNQTCTKSRAGRLP